MRGPGSPARNRKEPGNCVPSKESLLSTKRFGKDATSCTDLRRSSTHRNLGFGGASSNGDHTHGDDEDFDLRRANSVGWLSEEDLKKKAEVDSRVASYVSDQLERMRSNDSANANAIEDEIETKFDGADERTNGH